MLRHLILKHILSVLFLVLYFFVSAQEIETVGSIRGIYTMCSNKIYESIKVDPSKFVASVKGNQIVKLDSSNPRDVLFTILNEKVYRSSDTSRRNLLFYLKGEEIFLRTIDGKFRYLGNIKEEISGRSRVLFFLEPIEIFALLIAAKKNDN